MTDPVALPHSGVGFETSLGVSAIPGPRGRANLRGFRHLFTDLGPALDELSATYGSICSLGVPGVRVVVIGDPALANQMVSMKADTFRWGNKFNVIGVRFVVGKRSMIVSDGADHRRRRGAVQRAFTRPRLNRWIPMIVERSDAAIDQVVSLVADHPADRQIDLYPVGRDLILGVTLHAFFGERLANRVDEFSELFQRAQAFIEAPGINQLPHPFPFTSRSRVRADRRKIDRIIDEEVAARRTDPTGDPFDILDVIANDGTLTDAEIRDQVDTLIGAGYDTTASTFAWLLWCAALEPGVWSRLRAEADQILGLDDTTRPIHDDATLSRLEYAHRVVHESLRLHPAGLIGARVAARDIRLGDYVVKKGTLIAWSPYLVGRDPDTWTDPHEFNPDRYLTLTDEQKTATDRAWIPFGRGPHMCLGYALAQMELVLMIARFAQRLDLTPTSDVIPDPTGMVVNRPIGGAPFTIRPRSPSFPGSI
ncbi:MAG TPA: cytochrome P450 [Ilumatobacteraceae bacterium]|nr:cytochrome P450 [Ilumatobacteraceae bacterium]